MQRFRSFLRPRAALAAVLSLLAACSSRPSLSVEQRREIFEDAWKRIGEKHYDPAMGGVDWSAVKLRYAPKVDAAGSEGELVTVLNEMVGELKHSHVGVMPPDHRGRAKRASVATKNSGAPEKSEGPGAAAPGANAPEKPPITEERKPGIAGLRAAYVDGMVLVTSVAEGGPAARAGVRPGDAIVAIDGDPVSALLEELHRQPDTHVAGVVPYAINGALGGRAGSKVTLKLQAPDGSSRDASLERSAPEIAPLELGALGSMEAEFESRILDGNILYVRFTPCFVPLQEKLEQALEKAGDPAGVIIDVRDNPGGLGAVAMGVARHFFYEERELGSMRMRNAPEPLRFKVNPDESPYRGPLVILVNESSASTSEILGAGMQKLGRARIVGQTSMGAALPSVVERIAHDWRVQAVVADFTLPDGTSVEGIGVVPDVTVKVTRADYVAGKDPVLEAAVRELANAPRLAPPPAKAQPTEVTAAGPRKPCELSPEMDALLQQMEADPTVQKLQKAKTLRITTKISIMDMEGTSVTTVLSPDKMHSSGSLPMAGETLQVYDGKRGWSRSDIEGMRELQGEELGAFKRGARMDAGAWRDNFSKVEIVERKKDGERDCIVIRQTPHEGEGGPITLHLDAKTLLPYRSESTMKSRMGAIHVATDIQEYGDFDGVRMPKLMVAKVGGVELKTTIEKVEVDVPVDEAMFKKPAKKKKADASEK